MSFQTKPKSRERDDKGESRGHILFGGKDNKRLTERLPPRLRRGNNTFDRMWFIIRHKGVFTRRDLVVLAEVKRETARWYTKMLRRKGIVAPCGPQSPEWRLIKDAGPRRPCVTNMKK